MSIAASGRGAIRAVAAWLALGVAVPARGGVACVGDCNGDATVAINELVVGVNIALEVQPLTACEAFDASADGQVAERRMSGAEVNGGRRRMVARGESRVSNPAPAGSRGRGNPAESEA